MENSMMDMIYPKKQQKTPKFRDLFSYSSLLKLKPPLYVVVCDIETTGLDPLKDLIVEVGLTLIDLKSGEAEKLFDRVVREPSFGEQHKNSWVFNNSSLRYDEVVDAPMFSSFRDEIQTWFNKYPATAYNKQFDFGFLRQRDIAIRYELDCPMQKATPILKIPHWKQGYKYPSVEEAWRYYFPHKKYQESHRAYDDALHEAQIVQIMYQNKHWQYREIRDFAPSKAA
jgi:DNA polymerase III epsilon subunit-like protein